MIAVHRFSVGSVGSVGRFGTARVCFFRQ